MIPRCSPNRFWPMPVIDGFENRLLGIEAAQDVLMHHVDHALHPVARCGLDAVPAPPGPGEAEDQQRQQQPKPPTQGGERCARSQIGPGGLPDRLFLPGAVGAFGFAVHAIWIAARTGPRNRGPG